MDDIDRQIERDDILLNAFIARRKPVQYNTGRCFNCEEPIASGAYCDADCRHDHELRERAKAIG